MCGIAGYMGTRHIDESAIADCLRRMHHRGPDHAAYRRWVNGAGREVCFLHTRLKIIDLDERANQPMDVGSTSLIFNGEIYNYLELREDLKSRGTEFRTTSDTEVLLRTIADGGWRALDRCEGMWALASYDGADGSVTLSRDRFGEKPLYLWRDASGVYFGSEVKFIAALLGRRLDVNVDHLQRYMVNGYKSLYKEGHTFFQGLEELPAAGVLRIDQEGHERVCRYWEPRHAPVDDMTDDEAVAGARSRLIRSVELRLRADVPLAFCMSGGVDSNALISIAKRVFGYDVHGFTILSADERYDEEEIVREVVAHLGIRHTEIRLCTDGFLPKLRTLVRHHDAPVFTITYYAHWLLMEAVAAHGYRISVSGTAADELFTGYYDHHLAYLEAVSGEPELHGRSMRAWAEHIRPLVRNPHLSDPDLFVRDVGFRDHIYLDADRFSRYLVQPWSEPFAEKTFADSLLRNRMMNELFHEATPVILHEDDLNAMYFSIENRSPFLDRELFEFCNQIPTRHLIRDGFAKAVLRDAVRGIVPDVVADNRRKVGFNASISSLLDRRNPDVRRELLADSPIFEHVRRDKIEVLLDTQYLPNSESKFLFNFLNSKIFLEEFGS